MAGQRCGARPRAVALTEDERRVTLARPAHLEADVAGVQLLVAPYADVVVLEVNGIPGWQALQSVGDQDLTQLVVSACEALASRV